MILRILNSITKRRARNVLIFDRGFYAYRNCLIGINEYKITPLIFPIKNFKMERLDGLLGYPLTVFNSKNLTRERRLFKALKAKLLNLLLNWRDFKSIRPMIEDVFKLAKSMSLRIFHRYTMRSVYKFTALNALLVGGSWCSEIQGKEGSAVFSSFKQRDSLWLNCCEFRKKDKRFVWTERGEQ